MNHRGTLMLLVCLLVSSVAADEIEMEYGAVEARVISPPDFEGDLEISIMLPVQNSSDVSIHVALNGQALDHDGFEVYEFSLGGIIQASRVDVLTDKEYINAELYSSITTWRVQSVRMTVELAPGE